VNILLSHGHTRESIWAMNFYEQHAYVQAAEQNDNERLVLHMNAMAVAYGGTLKQRQEFKQAILGGGQPAFDAEGFDALFGMSLATPIAPAEKDDITAWAASEIASDQSGYLKPKAQ
jgi:hypothetical protein